MTRDPDYWRVALETAATGLGVLIALACWRVVVAVTEWVWP